MLGVRVRFFFISVEDGVATLLTFKGHNGNPFGDIKGAKKEDEKKNMEVNSIPAVRACIVYCKIPAEVPRQNLGELVRKLDILLEQVGWKNSARYGLQLLM